MKIADILRVLANNLDHAQGGAPDPAIQNPAGLIDVVEPTADESESAPKKTPSGNDVSPDDIFLPPLQLKQELLKKAVGVKNVYDDGAPGDQETVEPQQEKPPEQDIVDRIRYLGGVPTAALQELSNDEIFDD